MIIEQTAFHQYLLTICSVEKFVEQSTRNVTVSMKLAYFIRERKLTVGRRTRKLFIQYFIYDGINALWSTYTDRAIN